MRQAMVLVVGLALIFGWSLGLRSVLRQLRQTEAPERVPTASHVRPMPPAELPAGQGPVFQDTQVVPAATFAEAAATSTPVKNLPITKVVDNAEAGNQWVWSGNVLRDTVWLRGRQMKVELAANLDKAIEDVEVTVEGTNGVVQLNSIPKIEAQTPVEIEFLVPEGHDPLLRVSAQLHQTGSGASATFSLKIQTQAAGDAVLVRVPDLRKGPPSPDFVDLKQGDHYPWQPENTVTLIKGLQHQLTYRLRSYADTSRLFAIQRTRQGSVGDWLVTGVASAPAGNSDRLVELRQRVVFEGQREVTVRTSFLADGSVGSRNHAFSREFLTFTEDNRTPTVSNVQFRNTEGTDPKALFRSRRPDLNQSIEVGFQAQASGVQSHLACRLFSAGVAISEPKLVKTSPLLFEQIDLRDGIATVTPRFFAGNKPLNVQGVESVVVDTKTNGFRVEDIGPRSVGTVLGENQITIRLSRPVHVPGDNSGLTGAIDVIHAKDGNFSGTLAKAATGLNIRKSETDPSTIVIGLTAEAGSYQVRIAGEQLKDVYGNPLESHDGTPGGTYVAELGGPAEVAAEAYPVTPGVSRGQAPFVPYPEFVKPRPRTHGFNPSDKVETRVARLYFFRDAHRVAQILNRKVQSYNRQEVAVRRQLADKARQEADSLTTNRQISERAAVEAAKRTRELEQQLSDTQRSLNTTLQQLQTAASQPVDPEQPSEAQRQQAVVSQLENAARSFAAQVQSLDAQVRAARDAEVAANESWQQAQRKEELARTDQFRLETAAAHADPDTFAAGDPESIDPVAQVSISVIGEGLLHLRGPLKGVNQVRMMVDQIDAPQGQVRVNVHSTQINGDEADRLEDVANRIQTYIDQARFLTVQSGEMLRKAVVHVAAQRADEARGLYPGSTQAERDQLYLYGFFGRDFVDELRAMDSELLHTGNKLLALHSMDVTSLSSALTLLALANNGTRLAILQEFERLLQGDLTVVEQQYLQNAPACCTKGCKLGCKHHRRAPPLCLLAQNANFTSLRGFFDAQIQHDDTMSPLQREMIRLAQILKARLITEMEYKQRVMERAVIEERLRSEDDERQQLDRETLANRRLQEAAEAQTNARSVLISNLPKATAELDAVIANYGVITRAVNEFLQMVNTTVFVSQANTEQDAAQPLYGILNIIDSSRAARRNAAKTRLRGAPANQLVELFPNTNTGTALRLKIYATKEAYDAEHDSLKDDHVYLVGLPEERAALHAAIFSVLTELINAQSAARPFQSGVEKTRGELQALLDGLYESNTKLALLSLDESGRQVPFISIAELRRATLRILGLLKRWQVNRRALEGIKQKQMDFERLYVVQLQQQQSGTLSLVSLNQLLQSWGVFRNALLAVYAEGESGASPAIEAAIRNTDRALTEWVEAYSQLDAAQSIAQDARRPLDHKKFLDMLIDDLEEKYIELLEGTRAHTANIDNYLKRLTTSLDDDFNTQFYHPVFRLVREASQFKRVEFGQTETTNVLVNNREFGKVSPSATMEFDLPERDILIKEGLDAALAIYNDVGALVNDPNLLALTKLQSGSSPATAAAGTLGGRAAVRNVLPGLGGETAEQLLAQNAGSGPEFESNVEKLIPDPAIYKFETGTGYEIRPVIAPDGQAVVFDFHYLYTTQVREPVRADEKHLGRVKQHFIDTDVQLSNFELREVSRYVVALKAERTANGVPLLEDIPLVGVLWRPLPNREKSLQQNIIMAQATIFPTLFDLMGLRWAPAVSDLDPLRLSNREYLVRGRHKFLENRIYDYSSSRVDEFLRIPEDSRRADLYRSQETIPSVHPNGYRGPGLDYQNSRMREGYDPEEAHAVPGYIPARSPEGAMYLPHRQQSPYDAMPRGTTFLEEARPMELAPPSARPQAGNPLPPPTLPQMPAMAPQGEWQSQLAK